MIFITVGTTDFPFARIDRFVSRITKEFPKEKIVYQSKTSKLSSANNLKIYKELKYPNFLKHIKEARVIITHGGPATIFLSLTNSGSKPLVIPRKELLKEHVSDHQVEYAKYLKKRGYVKVVLDLESLNETLEYINNPSRNHKKNCRYPERERLVKKLSQYIKS